MGDALGEVFVIQDGIRENLSMLVTMGTKLPLKIT